MKSRIVKLSLLSGGLAAAVQGYRWQRRRQLVLMPKGINDAAGVTMRSSIRAAAPTSHTR